MRVFGVENCSEFSHGALVVRVPGINSAEGYRLVQELRPDILLVFGTGIVADRILESARLLALNAHTGLSPHYRGTECTFWPLYNGEPHMLGATIHECTRHIDGGDIFATGRPRLETDDCVDTVYARCVVVAADLYVRVVNDLVRGRLDRRPQDLRIGREYKAHMHGLRAELKVRRMMRAGLIRRYVEGPDRQLGVAEPNAQITPRGAGVPPMTGAGE
jgi:methionyl-tRNA formyltransferase